MSRKKGYFIHCLVRGKVYLPSGNKLTKHWMMCASELNCYFNIDDNRTILGGVVCMDLKGFRWTY